MLSTHQIELINSIWNCYVNASPANEHLRVDALNALCLLASNSVGVLSTLVDKVTLDPLLDCLSDSNSHVQHTALTMFAMLVSDSAFKLVSEKVSRVQTRLSVSLPQLRQVVAM